MSGQTLISSATGFGQLKGVERFDRLDQIEGAKATTGNDRSDRSLASDGARFAAPAGSDRGRVSAL